MTTHARKHLTAWLGVLAMWLVVVAPVVSQLVTAAERDNPAEGVICSAMQPAGHARQDDHGDGFAACGYCVFLTDHPPAPAAQIALPPLPMHGATTRVAATSADTPFSPYSPARPRGPPAGFFLSA